MIKLTILMIFPGIYHDHNFIVSTIFMYISIPLFQYRLIKRKFTLIPADNVKLVVIMTNSVKKSQI